MVEVASAQAPPNPGSILWGAGLPKVTNPPAPASMQPVGMGSIEACGTFTETAGWKLSGVVLYINQLLPGGALEPNLGGAVAGDPVSLTPRVWTPPLVFPPPAAQKLWGLPDPAAGPGANPVNCPIMNYTKALPVGKYQIQVGGIFEEQNPPMGQQPRRIPKLGVAVVVEIVAPAPPVKEEPGPPVINPLPPLTP